MPQGSALQELTGVATERDVSSSSVLQSRVSQQAVVQVDYITDWSFRYAGLKGSGDDTVGIDALGTKTGALMLTVELATVDAEVSVGDCTAVLLTMQNDSRVRNSEV